jgi:hypothetical protein
VSSCLCGQAGTLCHEVTKAQRITKNSNYKNFVVLSVLRVFVASAPPSTITPTPHKKGTPIEAPSYNRACLFCKLTNDEHLHDLSFKLLGQYRLGYCAYLLVNDLTTFEYQ